METLTDRFIATLADNDDKPEVCEKVAKMVMDSPDTPERTGLMAYLYHDGIGVERDLDKCFELAEKAAFEGDDPLGYFLLGFMCDNAETPDQEEGGPRQKYDHYDAERFYEICAGKDSRWRDEATMWLGDYYMNSAKGGDPDVAVDYYESIADHNSEAVAELSDYYWNLVMPEYLEDEEWRAALFKWTERAAGLDPEEYSYRLAWLYADGIGCAQSRDKAMEYFGKAYDFGDWRGAEAIAMIWEEELEEKPGMSDEEKDILGKRIEEWRNKANRLREEEARNEADPSQEED